MAAPLNVFSIPAGAPFLTVLAEAMLDGRLGPLPDHRRDPLALAGVTVLLPTRRAVRAFREVLIGRLGGEAVVLPVIRPIGDADEEEHLLDPGTESGAERLVLPPAIPRLARQLALAELTLAWGRAARRDLLGLAPGEPLLIPASAADAARLAADLARLMDDMATAGRPADRLSALAPDEHAGYFQVTLDFLRIAFETWPALLAERGMVDPVRRRDELILAEARRLGDGRSSGPVIAAGSTGSIPATAELLKAIAGRPGGALVLPGLDRDLDERAWGAIGETGAASVGHPQFGLKQLLTRLGIGRGDVAPLGTVPGPLAWRARLAGEALRPAETTDAWTTARHDWIEPRGLETALAGVTYLLAHNEREEALAIAVAIREALETPGTSVALVTPDRTIARRVAAELGRWGLRVDDSAPVRLDLSREGVFARLLAEAVAEPAEPARLLALLKHPFAAFGLAPEDCRRAARILEIAVFRGRRGHGGIARLTASLAAARTEAEARDTRHVPLARRRIRPGDWDMAARLAANVAAILGPLDAAFRAGGSLAAADAARLQREALGAATTGARNETTGLFDGPGGTALATLLDGIAEESRLVIAPAEWPPLLATLMAGAALTRPPGADPRVHIWGTLEARLQSADLVVLGGLDEKVWPAETRTDPWLSRTMRAELSLPPPEQRLGQAAHDFAEAFASPRVMLTRAEKRGGAPTVASRWLQRLFALAGPEAERHVRTRGAVYVELARDLDRHAGNPAPMPRPAPKPPLDQRPRSLSITEIEKLVRDPYEIYARHVLRLEPLDPLGLAPDYALKGTLVHDAIGKFGEEWRGSFDAAARDRLLALGDEALAEIADFPDTHALWRFRFAAMADWIVGWEATRAGTIDRRAAEIRGELALPAPAGAFTLRGRADRIDLRRDGRVEVLDFKTGTPPSARQVLTGLAPQLALEAAMVRAGAFGEEFRGRSVARLFWVALNAVERGQPIKNAVEEGMSADEVADAALGRLVALVAAFDDPGRGYVSRARPMFETRYESPYDHLARVREWALVESEEELSWFGPPRP